MADVAIRLTNVTKEFDGASDGLGTRGLVVGLVQNEERLAGRIGIALHPV